MSFGANKTKAPTSPAHDAFHLMFETADAVSLFWQPFFKGIGRWQLELAQAGAKHGRATIEFGHRVAHATNPVDIVDAQVFYWQQVGQVYSDANQHITQALVRATDRPAGIEILPVPKKRQHDTLRIEERTGPHGYDLERKVA